jgi:glycosyltransferase involved in cell wall biosynthesis
MPNVSVVMATYNGARFIDEQLASLLWQTLMPSELIVSDDGSTDETITIVEKFRLAAPFPVRVIRNPERLGYGANFLNAARHASGEFLAFCDQDDIWLPGKLEEAASSLLQYDCDLHVHTAKVIDSVGRETGLFSQSITKTEVVGPLSLSPWGVFYGFSMVFRRELFEAIDPALRGRHTFEFHGLLSHDLWVYFLAASVGRTIMDVQPLVLYRRHASNQTPSLTGTLIDRIARRFGAAAHPMLRRDEIAELRSVALERLSSVQGTNRYSDNAKAASIYWRRIADHERQRIALYSASNTIKRAFTFCKIIAGGGYRPISNGGLGFPLLVRDGVSGLLRLRRQRPST